MSRTPAALSEKPASSRSRRPNSITSSAPATLKRSFMVVFMAALSCIDSRVMAWSRRPTRRAGSRNRGSTATAIRVMRQFSRNMVTRVVTRLMRLEKTDPRVPVRARWAPTTSLLRRLVRAPVWVWVKKASGWRCTWSNRLVRSR